ncbi:MAG: topoisomerase IV, partial [Clostridia bacterium]|nr:topoisomerase IV [Clostridia bacterium]
MEGFSIDRIQAEYIAEIKLRHLNHEYLINRVHEIEGLRAEIKDIEDTLSDELKMKARIAEQLKEIKKKYAKPRKTEILYADEVPEAPVEEEVENYSCRVVLTRDGYFKKITHQSLRGNDEHRLKEGDEIVCSEDCENRNEMLVFTDKCQVYKAKVSSFEPCKASSLGDFLPSKLGFDEGEKPILLKVMNEDFDQNAHMIFVFENGKGVRIPLSSYETKSNRKRLTGAYSAASPIVSAFYEKETIELLLVSNVGKGIFIKSSLIPEKTTRTASGVILFNLKKNQKIVDAVAGEGLSRYADAHKCRKIKIPATGSPLMFPDIQEMQIGIE